jgi:hypothetical protein
MVFVAAISEFFFSNNIILTPALYGLLRDESCSGPLGNGGAYWTYLDNVVFETRGTQYQKETKCHSAVP